MIRSARSKQTVLRPVGSRTTVALAMSLIALAATQLTGCDKPGNDIYGRVAVLDLAKVENEMGRDVARGKALSDMQQQLGQRLNGIKESMQQQFEAERAKLGPVPAPEGIQRLDSIRQQMDARMRSEIEHAQQTVEQANMEMISKFRAEVLPFAQKAAADRGLTIVMDKAAGVLIASPSVEITDAVVEELRRQPQATTIPSAMSSPDIAPPGMSRPKAPTESSPFPSSSPIPMNPPAPPSGETPASGITPPPGAPPAPPAPITPNP